MHARNRGQRVVVSVVTAAAAALWLGGLSGCSSTSGNTDADYVKVCKDPSTGQRIEDGKCSDDTGSSGTSSYSHPYWVYQPISSGRSVSAPRVGEKVPSGYSDSKPSSDSKVTTSGRSGGSYSRGSGTSHGGFGSGSGSKSGSGHGSGS